MGSSICEVELCGALSVRWSYGKLCGVELWGALWSGAMRSSVEWSYGELCGVELWGALWSGAMGSSVEWSYGELSLCGGAMRRSGSGGDYWW